MHILIVEDETALAQSLQRGLAEEGFVVDCAYDGQAGLAAARATAHDVILLDWRLPKKDGLTVLRTLRQEGNSTPILMLTALGEVRHRVEGLETGADDYLAKPFSFEELLARIRALLRRGSLSLGPDQLVAGPLSLRTRERNAVIRETPAVLRSKEFLLLEALLRRKGQIMSRTVLCERVWGGGYAVSDNTVDVTVSGLRARLDEAIREANLTPGCVAIETVRGMGYRLVVREDSEQ